MATKHATEQAPVIFTAEHATRLQELVAKVTTGDAEEADFDELKSLTATKKNVKALRESSIAQTRQSLTELNITIHDLYGKDEIVTAAREYQGLVKAPAAKKPGATPGATRAPKTGVVLFSLKNDSGRGVTPTWTRTQKVPQYISKAFKDFYTKHGDKTGEELTKLASPENQEWLKTDEGKAKLLQITKALKEGKLNPKTA